MPRTDIYRAARDDAIELNSNTPDTQNLILLQCGSVIEIEYTGPADLKTAVLSLD